MIDGIGFAQDVSFSWLFCRGFAPNPGPGNGCRRCTHVVGRPSSRPSLRTSSLNSSRRRFYQRHFHGLGQAADIVVGFDHMGLAGLGRRRFDDIGVDSALGQPVDVFEGGGLHIENINERVANDFALFLGSASPTNLLKNCSSASTRMTFTPMFLAEHVHDLIAFVLRSRPLSTKTQVSWSPMALCNNAATTDESTPPESPSNTLSLPTWARTLAMLSSIIWAGVQSASQPQISSTKCSNIRMPCRACVSPPGETGHHKSLFGTTVPAMAQEPVDAISSKPVGRAITLSPWLIQTSSSVPPS